MSLAQLIFKKGNFIGNIELDVVITESASATVKLTENPVENGADINDHIIVEPMTFSMTGMVSNISTSTVNSIISAPASFSQATTKSREAWENLLELQIMRKPFTLYQGLKAYENVVILSLSESQDKDTANGLFFTATMKQVIFVGPKKATELQFDDSNISDKMIPIVSRGLTQLRGVL